MTPSHMYFIPAIFLLGFLFGLAIPFLAAGKGKPGSTETSQARVKSSFLALAFVAFIVMFALTHMLSFLGGAKALHAALGHQPLFDQHASKSAAEVYARLEAFGEAGRQAYQRFTYTADILFPMSLLSLLIVLALFVIERTALPLLVRRALISAPLVWFSLDMMENAIIYHLIAQFPGRSDLLADVLGYVTQFKFALLLSAIAFPAVSLALRRR